MTQPVRVVSPPPGAVFQVAFHPAMWVELSDWLDIHDIVLIDLGDGDYDNPNAIPTYVAIVRTLATEREPRP